MSEANKSQVGGSHYQQDQKPQHWDLVVQYRWDYFQAQITKYLMRWKTKHKDKEKKLEDLKKSRHFLDKYIEEYEQFLIDEPGFSNGSHPPDLKVVDTLTEYEKNSNVYIHNEHFLCEGGYGDGRNLYTCKKCRGNVIAVGLLEALSKHPHCAALARAPTR